MIETTTDEIGKEIETKDVIEIVIEIEIVEKPGVIGIMIDTRTGKVIEYFLNNSLKRVSTVYYRRHISLS